MRRAVGAQDGSCFGVSDVRELRPAFSREGIVCEQRVLCCENPFCQHKLTQQEVDDVGTRVHVDQGTSLKVCYECYDFLMVEPF